MIRNSNTAYGWISKALHWSMALFLVGLFGVGLYMTSLDYYDPLYHRLPWWHKSIGLLTIGLLIIRYVWKRTNTTPSALSNHKPWEVISAHLLHRAFYGLILITGISGYFISTAKGKAVEFFNLIEIASLTQNLEEHQIDLMGNIHELIAYTLAALVIVHIAGALKHHIIDKDNTLKRMLPGNQK